MRSANGVEGSTLRERPIGEVARDLTRDLSLLVRQEMELAKSEMTAKARVAAAGLVMMIAAAVAALMAAGALTACAAIVLAIFLPDWLAALLVGAGLAAGAYAMVMHGKRRALQAGSPIPEQTIETVKEDVEWAKTRAASARR
jgi:Putative Actinobacterial Holin-X, holin superfamily III